MYEGEYINLASLRSLNIPAINVSNDKYIDEEEQLNDVQKNGVTVYQVQGIQNKNYGKVVHVGFMEKLNDVLIRDFELFTQFKCYMMSRLYDINLLKKTDEHKKLNLIRINICRNSTTPVLIASLCLNFNHNKNDSIINYISDTTNKFELDGFYNITLHYRENSNSHIKYIELERLDTFCDENKMMSYMIKKLIDPNILELLSDIK